MNRRKFILGAAATLGLPSASLGQENGHSMHGMPAMQPEKGPSPAMPQGAAFSELPRLANLASQPGQFTAELTAAPADAGFVPGLRTPILAYNGQSPGPMIELTEGDRVRLTFRNRLDIQDTTIHWHGLPVPAEQDGNPMNIVRAGGDHDYEFEVPTGSAGTYWYHPHPHGITAEQVYRGLAGAFIVKAKDDPIPAAYGDTLLMFTDLRLAADGTMPANTMMDVMNGRVGDHVLVNGQKNPVLELSAGAVRRFRLLNATNARFLRCRLEGAAVTLIGSDGGLLEAPVADIDELFLAPGERLEIVARFQDPGDAVLRTLDYDRGWMGPGRPDEAGMALLTVRVGPERAPDVPPLPARLRIIPAPGQPVVHRRFVFSETMSMDGDGMSMGFLINGAPFDMKRVDVISKVGQVELWEVANQADMDHPFHIHGTQFQILEREMKGKMTKPRYRALKDTVNVRRGETLRLVVRQDLPGPRMYHCHILEHEDLGMMGLMHVAS